MGAKHRCNRDDSQKGPYPVNSPAGERRSFAPGAACLRLAHRACGARRTRRGEGSMRPRPPDPAQSHNAAGGLQRHREMDCQRIGELAKQLFPLWRRSESHPAASGILPRKPMHSSY